MSAIPKHFHLDFKPKAAQEARVQAGNLRFTVLTERLIRLEYHPQACFEDRPSQMIWYREQTVPNFRLDINDSGLVIETEYLYLRYENKGEGFTADNLSIRVKATDSLWHPYLNDDDNLLGTTRTLDFVNGYTPLGKGLLSRAGWAVLDDSSSLVFNEDSWLEPRENAGVDWYFFGYGHDYKACLQEYCQVSGKIPLIPRWILGNWWSRYWAYTQDELMQLIEDFEAKEIPLSICIVDMDWHITNTGNESTGWTGYTWNRELFPDPEAFLAFVHEKGLRTGFNLHPADGIHSHEEQYPEMARRMGIDPESKKAIEFDITSPQFANAYFELLHHPYEEMGVDFWWVDWQQGQKSKLNGLDPLWLINHLHFLDSGRDGVQRPFIFSRWGNEGHQRYPIGFSGDSYITWDSLRFQPYMTATASNVAYGWWSHDIGGHTSGTGDAELFTRWLQFGVFSPIMRIHSGKGYFYERRPWMFENAEVLNRLREAMQLRHAFLPYIYTMARRAHDESLPLMLPMYYEYPEAEAAYHAPQQYLFGTELIAAPFVDPIDAHTQQSRQVVWLPEGGWYHFFSGEYFEGNHWQSVYGTLKDIPLFAKAGAIVPLGAWNGGNQLNIHLFAGANNQFSLYEDDGETTKYQNGQYCRTRMSQTFSGNVLEFHIQKPDGDISILPAERKLSLVIHGVNVDLVIRLESEGKLLSFSSSYNEATETLSIENLTLAASASLLLKLETKAVSLLAHRNRKRENILNLLQSFRLHTGIRNRIADELEQILANPEKIAAYFIAMSDSQARALCEVLFDAGLQIVKDTQQETLIILWNNHEDSEIRYRYGDAYLHFGNVVSANHQQGIAPNFLALIPKIQTWTHGASGEHVRQTQWSAQIDYRNLFTAREAYREDTP